VPKHGEQWAYSLNVLAAPLRSLPVDKIDPAKILEVLQPCWLRTPDTAQRLRLRLERVLDWARAHGYREGENPARWRGHLKNLLPQQQRQRTHFAALPYAEVPALVQRLRTWESVSARALAFTILTACRTSEVLGARWDEIDFGAKVWTVPAARMKSRREFRVPLSDQAVDLLRELREGRTADVVFPGWRSRPINVSAMRLVLHELGLRTTVHGFRSSFRIWCAECTTSFPRDVVEMALAHVVGSAVERAYQRGDLLERRRELMQAWGAFCTASDAGNVVTLKRS
jgi:integrase